MLCLGSVLVLVLIIAHAITVEKPVEWRLKDVAECCLYFAPLACIPLLLFLAARGWAKERGKTLPIPRYVVFGNGCAFASIVMSILGIGFFGLGTIVPVILGTPVPNFSLEDKALGAGTPSCITFPIYFILAGWGAALPALFMAQRKFSLVVLALVLAEEVIRLLLFFGLGGILHIL